MAFKRKKVKSRLHKQKVKEKEKNVNLWQNRKEKCGRTLRTFNKQHLYSMVCFFFFSTIILPLVVSILCCMSIRKKEFRKKAGLFIDASEA